MWVVCKYPNPNGAPAVPMCGGVGAQYTPTAGWAQAIDYYRTVLKNRAYEGAMAVVLGGDASVATNGFWSALRSEEHTSELQSLMRISYAVFCLTKKNRE